MRTLVFSIIQSIIAFIIPPQLLQAVTDFLSKPPVMEEKIAGTATRTPLVIEPDKPFNFPAAVLPTTTSAPPLIGKVLKQKIKPPPPVETVQQVVPPAPPPVEEVKKVDPPMSLGQKVLNLGLTKKGDPYVWGATGPDAFDCSGLVYWLYAQFDIYLNRIAIDQASNGYAVSTPAPGDIIVLNGGSHVGIYAGDGLVLNAPETGDVVKLSPLSNFTVYAMRRI